MDERERACDEAVLSLGSEPQVYAEGILNVCKIYFESPLRCVSGVTGSDLKMRIQAILTGRVAGELNSPRELPFAVVAGIAAPALPVMVGMMNAPSIRAQSAVAPAGSGLDQTPVRSLRNSLTSWSFWLQCITRTARHRLRSLARAN